MYSGVAAIAATALLLGGCGGGGGGGGSGDSSAAGSDDYIVSGYVVVPNGQIASVTGGTTLFVRFADSIIGKANASTPSAFQTAPEGTPVELEELDDFGNLVAVRARTAVRNGQYSFNLSTLGLQPSSNLVVQVSNSAGDVKIRAFVSSANVDLHAMSEATVQMALQTVAATTGGRLQDFTVDEISELTAAIFMHATLGQIDKGASIQAITSRIALSVKSDPVVATFLTAAVAAGQTDKGLGDIGQYFPFAVGNYWEFDGTELSFDINGDPVWTPYKNRTSVTGKQIVNGVETFVISESNADNSGQAEKKYYAIGSRAISYHGNNDQSDTITPKLAPYVEVRLPAAPGTMSLAANVTGADWGEDIDGDHKNESADVEVNTQVRSIAGTCNGLAECFDFTVWVRTETNITIHYSKTRTSEDYFAIEDRHFAPGIGLASRYSAILDSEGDEIWAVNERLVAFRDQRSIPLRAADLIYDPTRNRIYATVPKDTTDGRANSVTIVDPFAREIGASVYIGNDPGRLAISDDGQFLYVALHGKPAIQRIDLNTMNPDLQISLGNDPVLGDLYANDVEAIPGTPRSVAVTLGSGSNGYGHRGVAVYDDAIRRTETTSVLNGSTSDLIEFSESPGILYGLNTESSGFDFSEITIDSSGAQLRRSTPNIGNAYFGDFAFGSGRVYTTSGLVIDPLVPSVVGTLPLPSPTNPYSLSVTPVADLHSVFALTRTAFGALASIEQYDFAGLKHVRTLPIQQVPISSPLSANTSRLLFWGDDGLAFVTDDGRVEFIRVSNR
jgi:hypothetical protein